MEKFRFKDMNQKQMFMQGANFLSDKVLFESDNLVTQTKMICDTKYDKKESREILK